MATRDPHSVRNVGLLGHGGTGKTTIIERILHDAGVIKRLGTVEEGNTVGDYLEEEKEHKHTISMKLSHVNWRDVRIHFVDHPGYDDFIGEMAASTPLLDGLIIVVDATTGIQVGTDLAWRYAEKHAIPRAFFVNKLDREHSNFKNVVKQIRETYGKQCVPLVLPIGEEANLEGALNIMDEDTGALAQEVAQLKEEIADAVAESDDALLEKYLETGTLSHDEFHQGMHDGIAKARIMPIIAGSAAQNIGITHFLDLVADVFPTPLDRHVLVRNGSAEEIELRIDTNEPFLAQVFRSVADPYVGQLTLFRVLTGALKSDSEFYNVSTQTKERSGKLYLLNGKEQTQVDEVIPGDIAAMTKLKNTHFGDTIAAPGTEYHLPPIEMPESVMKLAIAPKSRADEDKIGEALNRIAEEDPTFKHYRDEATGEHVIRGMGELQLSILLERMRRKYHVEAETFPPKVAYLETIKSKAEAQGKHKKQSGGHGQYGDVHIRISPNERGAGYSFVDNITGGVVPRQYIPHVDKGAQEALARGVISGHPVVDVVVELFFGSYHNVDSSEMAFKIAASLAIQKAVREARPTILEPILLLRITVPDDHMGDVTGDLNARRGRIVGMDTAGMGRQVITAHVPETEALRYATELRSMTGGRGSFEASFSHYDEAPDAVIKALVAEYEKNRAEGN